MVIRLIKCGECGKEVKRSRTTECLGCLERFHASCLHKVRKRRTSYRMCNNCLESHPNKARIVLDNEIDLDSGLIKVTNPL
jgi:hypothetical protein